MSQESNNSSISGSLVNSETVDWEQTVMKMLKDIEYLKEKVYAIESDKLTEYFKLPPAEVENQFMTNPPNRVGVGRGSRPIIESEIKEALEHVDCMAAVARYLGCAPKTLKKYAKKYGLWKPNPQGRGALTEKIHDVNSGKYPLNQILEGKIVHPTPSKLKNLLFRSGMKKKCCERCGWKESREDGVFPLVINFIDGNPQHQTIDNIKIYCYNCTFCLRGYIRRGTVVFDDVPSS